MNRIDSPVARATLDRSSKMFPGYGDSPSKICHLTSYPFIIDPGIMVCLSPPLLPSSKQDT